MVQEAAERRTVKMRRKKRKTKNRRNLLLPAAVYLFLICGILYLSSSVFLKSYNNSLSIQKQNIQTQILALEQQNNETQEEVNQLSSAARVAAVAQAELSYQAKNIVTVADGQ
jgi:cell division protein FtsL